MINRVIVFIILFSGISINSMESDNSISELTRQLSTFHLTKLVKKTGHGIESKVSDIEMPEKIALKNILDCIDQDRGLQEVRLNDSLTTLKWLNKIKPLTNDKRRKQLLAACSTLQLPLIEEIIKIKRFEAVHNFPYLIYLLTQQKQKDLWKHQIVPLLTMDEYPKPVCFIYPQKVFGLLQHIGFWNFMLNVDFANIIFKNNPPQAWMKDPLSISSVWSAYTYWDNEGNCDAPDGISHIVCMIKNDSDERNICLNIPGKIIVCVSLNRSHISNNGECVVAWSPDSKLAAIAYNKILYIWTNTGKLLICSDAKFDPLNEEITKMRWSPDSNSLITCSKKGELMLWDIESVKKLPDYLKNQASYQQRLLWQEIQYKSKCRLNHTTQQVYDNLGKPDDRLAEFIRSNLDRYIVRHICIE